MSITNPKIDFKEHGIEYEVMRKNKVGLYVLIWGDAQDILSE